MVARVCTAKVANSGVSRKLWDEKKSVDGVVTELYLRCYSRPPMPAELKNIDALLAFYMGKNTQERQDFIIGHLRIEKDMVPA